MRDKILYSESGKFVCDKNGFARRFKPASKNLVAVSGPCDGLTLKHLIVPEGVVGFEDGFGRRATVLERFVLPNTLRVIGRFPPDDPSNLRVVGRVFANAKLPTVVIPETVEFTGAYAFGGSEIEALCFPLEYTRTPKKYARAYKDCRVRRLYVHHTGLAAFFRESDCANGERLDWNLAYGVAADEIYVYSDREPGRLPTVAKRIR